jgi:transcriptional regulatory protein LevR
MGSLLNLEATIMERVGIKVKTIDMVSTPLVLEAVRKASIFDMNIEEIYQSLKDFRGYNTGNAGVKAEKTSNKVIVTVCSSGKGAAAKLKEFVEKVVYDLTEEKIVVVPAKVRELDKVVKDLRAKHTLLAVIGVKRPSELNVPFIPLEKLIEASGEQALRELLLNNQLPVMHEHGSVIVRDLCEDTLKEFMTYLNPHKILGILMKFIEQLEQELEADFHYAKKVQLAVHTAHALERMVIGEGLVYQEDVSLLDQRLIDVVNRSCNIFASSINIKLTNDEKYYICEILSEVYNCIPK